MFLCVHPSVHRGQRLILEVFLNCFPLCDHVIFKVMSLAEPGAPWPDWLANNLQKSRADCQHSEHRHAATAGFSAVEM